MTFAETLASLVGTTKTWDWNGFVRHDFTFDGRNAIIVEPSVEVTPRSCLWRARFFGAFPYVDMAMLKRGWYIVHIDIADLYGGKQAVGHWNTFYALLQKLGFPPKLPFLGMSRGGLIVYNWAYENPEKVACIYVDAPVCDIRSWPAGFGAGPGSPDDWERCKKIYGLTDETAKTFADNPIDHLEPLARARVPILHVCGDADVVVPYKENTVPLIQRYCELGGMAMEIVKPGVDHHPHSLEDPTPIVKFIERHCAAARKA